MFRTPFAYDMEKTPMGIKFTKFITKALEDEFRQYFLEGDGYDRIEAGDNDVMTYCNITEDEIALVDIDAVAKLFPKEAYIFFPDFDLTMCYLEKTGIVEAQKAFKAGTKLFLAKKFIQMVKMLKAEESFTPDILQEAIMCLIAENGYDSAECEFEGKEELTEEIIEYMTEGYPDDEYAKDIRESVKRAAYNLHSIFVEEMDSEIEWILWDGDYSYLLDGDFSLFVAMLTFGGSYSDFYMRSIYTSVDASVPYFIERAIGQRREIMPHREEIMYKYQEDLMSKMEAFANSNE